MHCNDTILTLMFLPNFLFYFFQKAGGSIDLEPCLTHTSTVEPTLAPVVVERMMTTRAAASVLSDFLCLLLLFIYTLAHISGPFFILHLLS